MVTKCNQFLPLLVVNSDVTNGNQFIPLPVVSSDGHKG